MLVWYDDTIKIKLIARFVFHLSWISKQQFSRRFDIRLMRGVFLRMKLMIFWFVRKCSSLIFKEIQFILVAFFSGKNWVRSNGIEKNGLYVRMAYGRIALDEFEKSWMPWNRWHITQTFKLEKNINFKSDTKSILSQIVCWNIKCRTIGFIVVCWRIDFCLKKLRQVAHFMYGYKVEHKVGVGSKFFEAEVYVKQKFKAHFEHDQTSVKGVE